MGHFFWVSFGQSFLIYLFIYLFIYLTTTGLHCGCRFFSCGMQLLGCSIWSPVPDQGSNSGLLHWGHGVLATGPPGKSQASHFNLPGSESLFGASHYLPMCAYESLSGWISPKKLMGKFSIIPLLTSKEFSGLEVKVSLTWRMRNMWSLIFIWAGASLFSWLYCYWYFGVSVYRK